MEFYNLMYGREARLPVDLEFGTAVTDTISPNFYVQKLQSALSYAYHIARDKLGIVQQRQKALYDSSIHGKPFTEGDIVWLYSPVIPRGGHRKLHHPWTGPYKVQSKLSELNYKIVPLHSSSPKFLVVHFNRLKRCPPRYPIFTSSFPHTQTYVACLSLYISCRRFS